jgi:hypothetical protein
MLLNGCRRLLLAGKGASGTNLRREVGYLFNAVLF